MQFRTLSSIAFQYLPVHRLFHFRERFCQFSLLSFLFPRFRRQGQDDPVSIVQQIRFNQRFKIISIYRIPQFLQQFFIFQAFHGIQVVNPGIHNRQSVDQSFGIGSKIRLP